MCTSLFKVITCDNTTDSQQKRYPTMELHADTNRLSADFQSCIEPPPIPLMKAEEELDKSSNIIKIKMCRNMASAK